jgi:hypothetical protein
MKLPANVKNYTQLINGSAIALARLKDCFYL